MSDRGRVVGEENVAERLHADVVFQVQKTDVSFGNSADPHLAIRELHFAQLHSRSPRPLQCRLPRGD